MIKTDHAGLDDDKGIWRAPRRAKQREEWR